LRAATAAAFARAAHITRLDTWINRVTGVPMEPRAAVGIYDQESGRYTTLRRIGRHCAAEERNSRQSSVCPSTPCASSPAKSAAISARRNSFFPEFAMVAWGSRRVGRPVKWTAERQEAFVSDYMGRDLTVSAELALDADGRFLALRTSNLSNVGAHSGSYVPLVKGVGDGDHRATAFRCRISGRVRCSRTTVPTIPYRSAGRPEVVYVMERLIDKAGTRARLRSRRAAAAQSHSAVGVPLQERARHHL